MNNIIKFEPHAKRKITEEIFDLSAKIGAISMLRKDLLQQQKQTKIKRQKLINQYLKMK